MVSFSLIIGGKTAAFAVTLDPGASAHEGGAKGIKPGHFADSNFGKMSLPSTFALGSSQAASIRSGSAIVPTQNSQGAGSVLDGVDRARVESAASDLNAASLTPERAASPGDDSGTKINSIGVQKPSSRKQLRRMAGDAANAAEMIEGSSGRGLREAAESVGEMNASRPPQPILELSAHPGRRVSPATRRLWAIMEREGFRSVALNDRLVSEHDANYTHEMPMGPVVDQGQSGRCTLFAGLNMILGPLIAKDIVPTTFGFSATHLYSRSLYEKYKSHLGRSIALLIRRARGEPMTDRQLRRKFKAQKKIEDGNSLADFLFLVSKYGLVPNDVMPDTASAGSSSLLLRALNEEWAKAVSLIMKESAGLDADGVLRIAAEVRRTALRRVKKILKAHLGRPLKRFPTRTHEASSKDGLVDVTPTARVFYTPQEFAENVAHFKADDYVRFGHYPSLEIGTVYEEKPKRVVAGPRERRRNFRFINTTPERLEELIIAAIKSGYHVLFSGDISHGVDKESAIMHPDIYLTDLIYGFTQEEKWPALTRAEAGYFELEEDGLHAMDATGYDQPKLSGPVEKIRVQNSHGDEEETEGLLHMYSRWVRSNVFEVVVPLKVIDALERRIWKSKKVVRISEKDEY